MSSNNSFLSKEEIASRMMRSAAQIWGYNEAEMDNFDPIVRLMIEACAVEVNSINQAVEKTQVRMLKKLASILNPDVYTAAKPSHAVMMAHPIENGIFLNREAQFFVKSRISLNVGRTDKKEDTFTDVFFSPAGDFSLILGQVKHLISSDYVYRIGQGHSKEPIKNTKNLLKSNELLVAVELDKKIEEFNELRLFIDFRNIPDVFNWLRQLSEVRVNLGEHELNFTQGYGNKVDSKGFSESDVLSFQNVSNRIEKETLDYYLNNFITIDFSAVGKGIDNFIKELPFEADENSRLFEEMDGLIKGKFLWLKLTFPAAFSPSIINNIVVAANCFPVLNRKLCEIRYRLQRNINIVPLFSDEAFLDIQSVENTEGQVYTGNPLELGSIDLKGVYSVRHSGVERFDRRNAKELLNDLVSLLRDESGAFAAYGQDFLSSTIKELNENIALIEKKLLQNNKKFDNLSSFLFIRPINEGDSIQVRYWTTNGSEGSGIRSGQKVELYHAPDINQKRELVLLTTSYGGRDELQGNELLFAYRSALITRDRVITVHDIENLAIKVFGKSLLDVNIINGIETSPMNYEGLVRTIDIHLKLIPPSDFGQTNDELSYEGLKNDFQIKLMNQSVINSRYRVFLDYSNEKVRSI
jgi:hypothetical protein